MSDAVFYNWGPWGEVTTSASLEGLAGVTLTAGPGPGAVVEVPNELVWSSTFSLSSMVMEAHARKSWDKMVQDLIDKMNLCPGGRTSGVLVHPKRLPVSPEEGLSSRQRKALSAGRWERVVWLQKGRLFRWHLRQEKAKLAANP